MGVLEMMTESLSVQKRYGPAPSTTLRVTPL
jgi:hypothetical protein